MKKGEKFENITTSIFESISKNNKFETVDKNVMLEGPDGPRQIDVLIRGKVGPFAVKTIVECKDYKRRVTVGVVDALHSKKIDVNADKAVLVTRNGFSQGALKKAKRLGISLCTVYEVNHNIDKFELEVPLLITEHSCNNISISLRFKAIENMHTIDFTHVSGKSIIEIVGEYWNKTDFEYQEGVFHHRYKPVIQNPYIMINDNRKLDIDDLEFIMKISTSYYLGYFNNMESSKFVKYIEDNRIQVIYDMKDLNYYQDSFQRFERLKDIPHNENKANFEVKCMIPENTQIKMA